MRSQVGSFLWCRASLPACTCADSKCLPSKSCRKTGALMTEEFSEVLKIITFLQMIHGSLKEGWFNCGGKNERLWITLISQKSLHLGVYYIGRK